jgi:hypothetical protein
VQLAVSVCEPLDPSIVAAQTESCAATTVEGFAHIVDEVYANASQAMAAEERRANGGAHLHQRQLEGAGGEAMVHGNGATWHGSVAMFATQRHGTCLLASLGHRATMVKSLLDPTHPRQGLLLEYSLGTRCERPAASGDGARTDVASDYHRAKIMLLCAADAKEAQRVGWQRHGCEWEFTMRYSGACALPQPPEWHAPGVASPTAPASDLAALALCSRGCLSTWLGDGTCDKLCNNTACGFDRGDCRRPVGKATGGTPGDSVSPVEHWLCGVHASYGGGDTTGTAGGVSYGGCMLQEGRLGDALHKITPDALVGIVIGSVALLLLLLAGCACLCTHWCVLRRRNRDYEIAVAKYKHEARRSTADEISGIMMQGALDDLDNLHSDDALDEDYEPRSTP